MSSATPSIEEGFISARDNFLRNLKDPDTWDLSKYTSIDDVWAATEEIQKEQAKTGTLRALGRIKPYLEGLNHYVSVIDTFAQIKSDLLCLIWGPVKLMLQISSTLIKCFDRVVEVIAEVGRCLPHFQKYTELFKLNEQIKAVLCLFYRDILDFHVTILNFFRKSKWKVFFESLWPRSARKISVIQDNIVRHKALMNSEVTFENVVQAHEARERAYREYERTNEFQDWQNFESVKASLSPYLYDKELENFAGECLPETGRWLNEEENFRKWSDPDEHSVRLFWLQGIPGAGVFPEYLLLKCFLRRNNRFQGKTIMSSVIVRHKRESGHNILFAFVSHSNESQNSALKVLQSLVFQMLYDHRHLQPIMHEAYISHYRQIVSSLEFNIQLFSDLIKDSGPVFVVIDGADEMPELERQRLLKALTGQLKGCQDMKLLVSSRGERDILSLLGDDVPTVRVDHKNASDIEAYIQREMASWLPELRSYGADENHCLLIKAWLKPVSVKAKGMFLYAKLVVRNAKSSSNLDVIEDEIRNLPDGLDGAYGRILTRIKHRLNMEERQEACTILEWIGCATLPLKEAELLQAMVIKPGGDGFSKSRKAFRDIIKLCGPIIEIEDDVVQFVHFTAKEYIFGKQSDDFLKDSQAHFNIGSICLSYLSFDCFDEDVLSGDLGSNILSGDYILLTYAATEWLEHVRKSTPHLLRPESLQSLRDIILTFVKRRKNYFFRGGDERCYSLKTEFQAFEESPDAHNILTAMDRFLKKRHIGFLDQNDESWVDNDPCTISSALDRIRIQLEDMLCPPRNHKPGCHCTKLRSIYGAGLYRCDRLGCRYYRTGFDSRSDRDSHLILHNRPFKCPEPTCDFAGMGFRTEHDLSCHSREYHQTCSMIENMSETSPINAEQKDLKSILKDAVRADEVKYVRDLLTQIGIANITETELASLMLTAAKQASPDMFEPFGGPGIYPYHKPFLLEAAIGHNNIAVVKYLLSWDRSIVDSYALQSALDGLNLEAITLLLDHGADFKWNNISLLFAANLSSEDEGKILECLQEVKKFVPSTYSKKLFSEAFHRVAHMSLSIALAEFYLDSGAVIDDHSFGRGKTALYYVVQKGSARAPEFVKYLLQRGANPYPTNSRGGSVEDLVGMRKIEKHFGMSWDELVKSVESERAAKTEGIKLAGDKEIEGDLSISEDGFGEFNESTALAKSEIVTGSQGIKLPGDGEIEGNPAKIWDGFDEWITSDEAD